MRIAHIENGVVTNVSIAPDDFELPDDGAMIASETAAIGDIYQGGVFIRGGASFNDKAVKIECRRRILLVASETTQSNTTAAATAGWPREPDEDARAAARSAYLDGIMWIYAMIDASRALIAAQDVTFKVDGHWPQAPATAVALAARY